jgi:hypothetical protein
MSIHRKFLLLECLIEEKNKYEDWLASMKARIGKKPYLQKDCEMAKLAIKKKNLRGDLTCLTFTLLESSSRTPISWCRIGLPYLVSSAISSFMLNETFSIFF